MTGKLVFQERSGGKIYVHDLANGSQRVLTTGADPALSPDGRTVAFWRENGGDHELYLIDSDGANERRIFTSGKPLRAPAWSPDGSKIVFSRVNGERRCRDVGYNICMPDAFPYNRMFPLKTVDQWGLTRRRSRRWELPGSRSGGERAHADWAERGSSTAGRASRSPRMSPMRARTGWCSASIAIRTRPRNPAAIASSSTAWERITGRFTLQTWIRRDAKRWPNVTALTRPATTLYTPLPHNVAPVWSPDGQHIVSLSNRTGQWKFWVMNPDGSGQRELPVDVPIDYNYQAEQVVSWGK